MTEAIAGHDQNANTLKRHVTLDFDHHRPNGGDPWAMYGELRGRCPVAWSDHHGGFWVVTKRDDVGRVMRDYQCFSSARDLVPGGGTTQHIPSLKMQPMIPSELDPPESLKYRRLLNPLLSPQAVANMQVRVCHWTERVLDRLDGRSHCDLIYDFAAPVPAAVTVEWIGMPFEDNERISTAYHDFLGHSHDHPVHIAAEQTLQWLYQRVQEELEDRMSSPRDDVLSYLVAQSVDGRPVTLEEARLMATILISGGVETTTTAVAWAMLHLHRDREDRAQLIADPELWMTATDELLRRYPPIVYHARVVKKDTEIQGCPMRRGDRVMAVEASACHDADEFPDPYDVVLDRFPNRHLAFGLGSHRCVGMHLAKLEIREMMKALLRRFPDYSIDEHALQAYPDQTAVAGWARMPAVLEAA